MISKSLRMDEAYEYKPRIPKALEEDENILALQADITKVIKEKRCNKVFADGINDEDPEEVDSGEQSKSLSVQFSVNVKVEKCDVTVNQDIQSDEDINNANNTHLEKHRVNNKETIKNEYDDSYDKMYFLRKVLPHSKKNTQVPIKEYKITKKTILEAMEVQAKENTTQVDKYLDIQTRNFHGYFKESEKSIYDILIEKALDKWKYWYDICPSLRNSPLLYICFICKTGWWRLYTFREHIKMHKEKKFKITTESCIHDFYIAAYTEHSSLLSIKSVNISSNCWKCGKSVKFHPLTKAETSKYQCEGCKGKYMSCTKLTQHEGTCEEYMDMKCRQLNLKSFECKTCSLCSWNFINQSELDIHMTQCHLVRSDEPVLIQAKCCTYCHRSLHAFIFHNCPNKKVKDVKCKYCCRKFSTKSSKNLHMQFNDGIFKCFVCGISVIQCMAMEHMVEHSKNYMLLYQCTLCKDNILYTTETTFQSHLRGHKRTSGRRRWNTRVLLPTKCVNGEIVESETIINIPVIGYQFTISFPKMNDIPLIMDNTKQSVTNNVRKGILNVDDNNYGKQARLDAEIQKDVEMEAAISKVFRVSNTYQKLMEKETEEPMEEDFYEDDLIILHRRDEIIVISDSDSEEACVKKEIEENIEDKMAFKKVEELNVTKTVIKEEPDCHNNKVAKENPEWIYVSAKVGDATDYKNEKELNLNSEIIIKEEPEWNDITSKVRNTTEARKEKLNLYNETVIKEEPDRNGLTDSNEEESDTSFEKDHKHSNPSAKQKCTKLLKYNPDDDKEIVSDGLKIEPKSDQDYDEMGMSSKRKLYICEKCLYKDRYYYLYVEHVATCCFGVSFSCSQCSSSFSSLTLYAEHLTQHNYKKLTCPDCLQEFKHIHFMCKHIKKHLRQLIEKRPKYDVPETSEEEERNVFQCNKCKTDVTLDKLFNHWEAHLNTTDCEMMESQLTSNDSKDCKKTMDPELLESAIATLLIVDKNRPIYCIVCNKQFSRRNECKRHIIEHLLTEALRISVDTDNMIRCQICNMDFTKIDKYKQHMREHASLPLYKCDLCSKCFSDCSNFSKHRKVHNLFSYVCDLCGGKFHAKPSLIAHLEMHNNKTYECGECKKMFGTMTLLKRHIKVTHMKHLKSYPCRVCSKRFGSLRDKWNHLWFDHKMRSVKADCPLCESSYRRRIDLKRHMKTHVSENFKEYCGLLARVMPKSMSRIKDLASSNETILNLTKD